MISSFFPFALCKFLCMLLSLIVFDFGIDCVLKVVLLKHLSTLFGYDYFVTCIQKMKF